MSGARCGSSPSAWLSPPCTASPTPADRPAVRLDDDGFYGRPFPQDGRTFDGFTNPDGNDFVAGLLDGLQDRAGVP